MTIYLDNCCYNRPFDDQTQERIHLESEAILAILQRGQAGMYKIVGSNVLELEMERMHDIVKKQGEQYDLGYGDYTKEKQNEPDDDFDEIDALLKM